ncbi:uncharacterized protein LOC119078789 [Bradysia coprophila]|uniref:uncharacterized protein LOC119078789 n=1 Tax=Bradysia coprophila TaxID=38358 RepID=UPI00187D8B61|nr:uncharacterized protein LOC119078789 [Bradysia coprophila]
MTSFYHIMNDYIRGTQELSARFRDAQDTFDDHRNTATNEQLAEDEYLKQTYNSTFDKNSAVMIQLPRQADLRSKAGLAVLYGTKDNCLNKLTEVVRDMENLADEVSGVLEGQYVTRNLSKSEQDYNF